MRRRIAVLLTAVIGGAVGTALTGAPAAASAIPFDVDFRALMPNETREARTAIVIPVDSTVVKACWDARSGDGVWEAELCDAIGVCTPIQDIADTTLRAGAYELVLQVTLPDAPAASVTSAQGSISLFEAAGRTSPTGVLAATGGVAPLVAAGAGAALLGGGAAILLRRRRDQDEERTP